MRKLKTILLFVFFALISLQMSACAGSSGFPPIITAIKPQSVSYGRTATIYLGGKDLRSSLLVDSNGGCINPSFASNSTTDLLVLNCVVKVVGEMPLTFKTASGEVVYTATIDVPNPQVTLITSKGAITLELDRSKLRLASLAGDDALTSVNEVNAFFFPVSAAISGAQK